MSGISSSGSSGSGGSNVLTLTGNSGGAVGPSGGNINIVGTGGVTIAGNPGTSTLTVSVSGSGMTWNLISSTTATMSSNNAYVANNAGLVTLTLPATAAFGDVIQVVGKGAGGWSVAQNAGQTIHFGTFNTTTGVGGSLASTQTYDSIEMVCIIANTDFVVYTSVGNLTVV